MLNCVKIMSIVANNGHHSVGMNNSLNKLIGKKNLVVNKWFLLVIKKHNNLLERTRKIGV